MPTTLYQRWQKTAAENPHAVALTDAKSELSYTFAQLESAIVSLPVTQFPSGNTPDFILQTLAAWRHGLTTCPREPDSTPLPDLRGLPPGTAHVKTTSGSTGSPRLILFSAGQLAADADNIVVTMALNRAQPNIGVISMAHSYGFSNLVLPLLLHGIPLGGDPLPGSFARSLTHLPESGGTIPAVPAMWRAWLKAGCLDRDKIQTAISAGAPLTCDLESAIYHQTGIKVHNFYGSSECGGIAYDRSDSPRENPDAVGTPMHGVRVSTNADGCLVVSGEAVGTTYWPEPDRATLAGQKFTTQDLATIAADGTIHLRGRAGDLINIAGRKLDPSSIEAELLNHPGVDHCIVFGIPSDDPERVEEIVAITSGGDAAALGALLAKKLPAWQKVRHWWINPELTANSRGKISRSDWREHWRRHRGVQSDPS